MGFNGALCIHPTQVAPINKAYRPTGQELELAHEIVAAYKKGLQENSGVVKVHGKMIDLPVVERAQKTIDSALKY
jgi:citrate lyase subunit beta/citryl-CoA lyase